MAGDLRTLIEAKLDGETSPTDLWPPLVLAALDGPSLLSRRVDLDVVDAAHILPDADPRGGVRHVIPGIGYYLRDR